MEALSNRTAPWRVGRRLAPLLIVVAWLVAGSLPAAAQATADLTVTRSSGERRIALVIGNGDYQKANKLANPVNDARAMGAQLKKLGFDVISIENGTQQAMRRAVGQFSNKLGPDAVSLFFYAGHGMQVNGHNYLIPVDAEISTEQTVRLETVDVDAVIDQMAMAKSRINLVILDACRNNPYERRFRSQSGGLASIEAPTGTLIAYATSPGKVAADGDTGNGLYTSELLKAIEVPGAKVEDVFKRVRGNVVARSKGDQTPWEASSLTGDFYFSGPTTVIVAPPGAGGAAGTPEMMLWASVKDSRNPVLIQTYVDQFPQGVFAGAAKVMIEDLKRNQVASVPAKPDVAPAPVAEAAVPIEEIEGAYITVKRANLRDKPVADGKLVKALEPGVPVTVTGRVKDTQWYRAVTADGKLRGFVFGDAIQDVKAAEEAEWQHVKDAKQSAAVVGFLRRFPAGSYAEPAKALRDALAKDEAKPAVTPAAMVAPPSSVLRPSAATAGYPVGVGQSFRDCANCPEMVVIPAGSFVMGSSPAETSREGVVDQYAAYERPQHSVRVGAPLAVGKFHVTRGEFARFIEASGYSVSGGCLIMNEGGKFNLEPARSWRDPAYPQTDRDPVVCVSWNDAKAYAQWLSRETGRGYRLLTEAEWEYAARGGTSTARWWGDASAEQCRYANGGDESARQHFTSWQHGANCQDGYVFTSPGGSFPANPFGLHDMLGNASQWVEDCWQPNYEGAPGDASIAVASGNCGRRGYRGGSWSYVQNGVRAANRLWATTGYRDHGIGFRIARSPAG